MTNPKTLFKQLNSLTTEMRNPATMDLDAHSAVEILDIINKEDQKVALVVEKELPYIAEAVNIIVGALRKNGRLIYVGAGTSGRLGVLDAVECPPTYGTDPEMIQGMIAGGDKAMFKAQEGAEDKEENGAKDVDAKAVSANDVVCGIAASLRTPYVIGAVKRAKELGAATLYVTTNPRKTLYSQEYIELSNVIDVAICPEVGPEVIMGSTRMKSGTAQKLVLNMLTTTAMVQMGKVYENMMIDLQMTNAKLKERAKKVVMTITGITYDEASAVLDKADGHVKTALVMIKAHASRKEAESRLKTAEGFVRDAIEGRRHKGRT